MSTSGPAPRLHRNFSRAWRSHGAPTNYGRCMNDHATAEGHLMPGTKTRRGRFRGHPRTLFLVNWMNFQSDDWMERADVDLRKSLRYRAA